MLLFGPGIDFTNDEHLEKLLRLQGLSDALDELMSDKWPSVETHPNAPLIEGWRFVARKVPCLHGHIGTPSGSRVLLTNTTSEVIAFSPQLGWARTRHRWYRLGAPDQNRYEVAPHNEADSES